ncbi:MAG: hypothetical protein ACO1OR_09900 [Hydrogenophaga sp.]
MNDRSTVTARCLRYLLPSGLLIAFSAAPAHAATYAEQGDAGDGRFGIASAAEAIKCGC